MSSAFFYNYASSNFLSFNNTLGIFKFLQKMFLVLVPDVQSLDSAPNVLLKQGGLRQLQSERVKLAGNAERQIIRHLVL